MLWMAGGYKEYLTKEGVFTKEAERVQKEIDSEKPLSDENNFCGVGHRNYEERSKCDKCK